MTDRHECSATVFGPRVHSWQCVRSGVLQRKGKWYCRQHDPVAVETRRHASRLAHTAKRKTSDAIDSEGTRIARALGVGASTFYSHSGPPSQHGYVRYLVIAFDDCLKLIERLKP